MCDLTSLRDLCRFAADDLGAHDILINKGGNWYIWTSRDTLIPADGKGDRDEYHDTDEREAAPALDDSFGKPVGIEKSWKTVYIWVEG